MNSSYMLYVVLSLIIIITLIVSLLYVIFRNKENKQTLEEKINEIKENIKVLINENKSLNDLNYIQYSMILEFKAHLSSLIAPFKELLELDNIPEQLNREIQIANKSSLGIQNLSFMVEDLHNVYLDHNIYNIEKRNINDLINIAISYYNHLLNNGYIKFFVLNDKSIIDIWIDYNKMGFVIKNIISNSYRHINYNGTIWVSTKKVNLDNNEYCLLSITDDGYLKQNIEFDSIDYKKNKECKIDLCKEFLGLKVISFIVNKHNGRFTIKTNKEGFIVYSLYIPMDKRFFEDKHYVKFIDENSKNNIAETNEIVEMKKSNEQVGNIYNSDAKKTIQRKDKKSILIIDDHKDIQILLKLLFENDYNIFVADNGKNGYEVATAEIPDIIVSDVMMPELDGFDCCKLLKENIKTCYIPIVLLTALADENDIVKGLELGIEDYIVKPFNPKIFKSKIDNIVAKREKLRHSFANSNSIESIENRTINDNELNNNKPFINSAISIIKKNINNPDFGVKMLSESMNMSQPTLYRKIKQSTNVTSIELIVGIRLKTSAELLMSGKHNVQEVAEMVGYNDIATFRKHFIDFYGVTPSLYSKKNSHT